MFSESRIKRDVAFVFTGLGNKDFQFIHSVLTNVVLLISDIKGSKDLNIKGSD